MSVAEPALAELFCESDDFCQQFLPAWQRQQLSAGERKRRRASGLSPSKNISQIEHTRHRSLANCMVNLLAGLAAYTHRPMKPSIYASANQLKALNILISLSRTDVFLANR